MNIKNKCIKYIAIFSSVILLVYQFNIFSVEAKGSDDNKTVVIAGSDFQSTTAEDSARKVKVLLESMKKNGDIFSADGFLFCGDYSRNSVNFLKDNIEGVDKLKSAVSGFVEEENVVLAQGNHDCEIGTAGMSPSGNNDPKSQKYGVFVINEDDYMWCNTDKQRIKDTAESLGKYLEDKLEKKFQAPIFIVSHLPLHASMRTKDIGDARYANYIFDVLNNAGNQGLNIIFLFGHNHADGWDDYLGGSSVYLPKGDDIIIAQGSIYKLSTEKLSFYYMNAGYVGYYANCNEGADSALTMTSFVFDNQTMEIIRYTGNKIHNLKSKGVINSYKDEDKANFYSANIDIYESPQSIKLNLFTPISDSLEETSRQTDALVVESIPLESVLYEEENKSGCGSTVCITYVVFASVAVSVVVGKNKKADRR